MALMWRLLALVWRSLALVWRLKIRITLFLPVALVWRSCGAHVALENKVNLKQNEEPKITSKLLKILMVKRTKRSVRDCGAHVALEVIPVPMWEKNVSINVWKLWRSCGAWMYWFLHGYKSHHVSVPVWRSCGAWPSATRAPQFLVCSVYNLKSNIFEVIVR